MGWCGWPLQTPEAALVVSGASLFLFHDPNVLFFEARMAEKVVIGNAELWHGDCREVLPLLPVLMDNRFKLVPPCARTQQG